MTRKILLLMAVLVLSVPAASRAQLQKDDPTCKDHPLFTRMPNMWLRNCEHKTFDEHKFVLAPGKTTSVEGEVWSYWYYPQASVKERASVLQIFRNFENAARSQGGTLVGKDNGRETLKLVKDGNEIWVDVWAEFTGKYSLTILQKKSMEQDIVANAATFATGLKTTGHIVVEGIYFDTAKSDLKPESQAAIGEIAKLLKADPALKLYVVGHTDNVGLFDANIELSRARANAVVQSLVTTHGIAAARLRAAGDGPTAPVGSNDTEEGRAKNRRVELVKQ